MSDQENLEESKVESGLVGKATVDFSAHLDGQVESEAAQNLDDAGVDSGDSGVEFSKVVDIPAMVVSGVEMGGAMVFGEHAKMSESEADGLKVLVPAVLDKLGLGGDGQVSVWGALAMWSVAYAVPRLAVMQSVDADGKPEKIESDGDKGDISNHG